MVKLFLKKLIFNQIEKLIFRESEKVNSTNQLIPTCVTITAVFTEII